MPLDARCVFVLGHGEPELRAALRLLTGEDAGAYRALSIERLAWAIAFNVTDDHLPKRSEAAHGKRSYLDYWPPDTPWADVWRVLNGPVGGDDGKRSALAELGASVACEYREEWQHPSGRPIDHDLARQAFAALYARSGRRVAGYVWSKFRERAGDPQQIAADAWARVFVDYWSAEATRRVLGTSAITSLVCGTAFYVGCDALRPQKRREDDEHPGVQAGLGQPRGARVEWRAADQADRVIAADLANHIDACRRTLPARQQIVARLAWDHQIRQVDLARTLGVSAPAVSQLLDKARTRMAKCLKDKGFDVSADGRAKK